MQKDFDSRSLRGKLTAARLIISASMDNSQCYLNTKPVMGWAVAARVALFVLVRWLQWNSTPMAESLEEDD